MLYSGVTGKISIKKGTAEAVDVLHMSGFSVDISKDIIEDVSFGRSFKEKIPSIMDWSASADGSADFETGAGQDMLLEAFYDGAKIQATFHLDNGTFLRGDGYVESLSISHAADGKAEVSIGLAGNDAVALTAAAGTGTVTALGDLVVTSAAGTSTNDTKLTVAGSAGVGNKFVYRLGTAWFGFGLNAALTTGWLDLTSGSNVEAGASATKATIAEVTSGNLAVGRGVVTLIKKV